MTGQVGITRLRLRQRRRWFNNRDMANSVVMRRLILLPGNNSQVTIGDSDIHLRPSDNTEAVMRNLDMPRQIHNSRVITDILDIQFHRLDSKVVMADMDTHPPFHHPRFHHSIMGATDMVLCQCNLLMDR
jgi:hypothetical protein